MQISEHFVSGPDPCSYLSDREAIHEYVRAAHLTPDEYERLMNAGWRKFGSLLFRPVCTNCAECRPLRILAAEFAPSRSQSRVGRRNADLEVRYAPPSVDDARLALLQRYQAGQTARKGWPEAERTERSYRSQFVRNPVPSVEISIWEEHALRAVVLADITPNVVSGIYHFYEPDCRERGLGTFAMLQAIDLARRLGKRWAYFGFYVADCPSMRYKAQFHPHEILGPDGHWHREPGIISHIPRQEDTDAARN